MIKQTLPISDPFDDSDSFDVPYLLEHGGPYKVSGRRFGRPQLLWLRDYNGDGTPLEVAFFSAESSSDIGTTVLGYDPKMDALVQYMFHISITESHGATTYHDSEWLQGLFWYGNGPRRPPVWKYEADYPGGPHQWYDVHYDSGFQRFDVLVKEQEHE